jgi:hypothetical protein
VLLVIIFGGFENAAERHFIPSHRYVIHYLLFGGLENAAARYPIPSLRYTLSFIWWYCCLF